MTIDEITTALRQIPDADFEHIFDEMIVIRQERQARPQVEQAQVQLLDELVDAGVLEAPATSEVAEDGTIARAEDWVDPEGDPRRAYRLGDLVRHQGDDWESTHPGLNKEEPGTGSKWARRVAPTVDGEGSDTAQDEGTTQDGKTVPPGQAKKQK